MFLIDWYRPFVGQIVAVISKWLDSGLILAIQQSSLIFKKHHYDPSHIFSVNSAQYINWIS